MEIAENKLSADAQSSLMIMRKEVEAGRIPFKDAEFLRKSVVVAESMGIVGGWIVKFAAFLAAMGSIYVFFKTVVMK